ncbi:MAG: hypothetical protein RLY47_546 [Candidatus Parcubacteria bacterium]|jgi:guanylate kinase
MSFESEKGLSNKSETTARLEELVTQQEGRFDDQVGKLEELMTRYSEHPISVPDDAPEEVKAARQSVQKDPTKIVESLFASRETILDLQKPYDEALDEIAAVNGIDPRSVDREDLVRTIEQASIDRESPRIKAHLAAGGKIAAIMLGIGGTGKGTVIERSDFDRTVNHTTRPSRPGEVEGKDYHYRTDISPEMPLSEVEEALGTEILADLVRPGRGRYMTSKEAVEEALKTSNVVFIEQSPEKVQEIADRAREIMPDLLVLPVCILPPGRGILELATRVVVRSYGDPNHRDSESPEGVYKIKDSYLTSTIGPAQIEEISDTQEFLKGENAPGIVYVVNDDLDRAVATVNSLFSI